MDYYDGNTVTVLWNYAQHYAMSDNSYGTTFGPSAPGAINLVSGDTGGVDMAHEANSPSVASAGNPRAASVPSISYSVALQATGNAGQPTSTFTPTSSSPPNSRSWCRIRATRESATRSRRLEKALEA